MPDDEDVGAEALYAEIAVSIEQNRRTPTDRRRGSPDWPRSGSRLWDGLDGAAERQSRDEWDRGAGRARFGPFVLSTRFTRVPGRLSVSNRYCYPGKAGGTPGTLG